MQNYKLISNQVNFLKMFEFSQPQKGRKAKFRKVCLAVRKKFQKFQTVMQIVGTHLMNHCAKEQVPESIGLFLIVIFMIQGKMASDETKGDKIEDFCGDRWLKKFDIRLIFIRILFN